MRTLLAALVLAAGCMPAARVAQLQQIAGQPLVCRTEPECEMLWGRSLKWLRDHSHWKLRNVTPILLDTEGPMESVWLAYSVQKVPQLDGTYAVDFDAWCGDPILGCVPQPLEAKASFTQFVLGGSAQVPPLP